MQLPTARRERPPSTEYVSLRHTLTSAYRSECVATDTLAPVIDVLDALYGIGAVPAAESSTEPTLATINARFASLVAELQITRVVLLAAQHQANAKIDAQDVRLSAFGDAIAHRHR